MKKLSLTLFALICAITCLFAFTACGKDDGTHTVAVTGVTLNKTELTLESDGEETLTATVAPDDATDKTVVWSVSPAGVVTVNDGKVTAVAEGTATITATAGGKSATCAVTVAPEKTDVNATEWQAALNIEKLGNVTAQFTWIFRNNATGESFTGETKIESDLKNNRAAHSTATSDEGTEERYYTEEDGVCYSYRKKSGESKFVKEKDDREYESEVDYFDHAFTDLEGEFIPWYMGEYASRYEEFTYNSADKTYTCESFDIDEVYTLSGIKLKFSNGKLVYMEQVNNETTSYGDYEDFNRVTFSKYGDTAVTAPTDFTVSNGESDGKPSSPVPDGNLPPVSKSEWTQIMENADRFTVKIIEQGADELQIKTDGNKIYYESGQDKEILVKDGGDCFRYSHENSAWTREYITTDEYEAYAGFTQLIKMFAYEYDSFTYSNGAYRAEYLETEISGQTMPTENISMVFAGGLICIDFDIQGISYKITAIGETNIDLPASFTEVQTNQN